MNEETIECPCYPICSALGIETGQWCRYHASEAPPPGMHAFNPKDTWCPPGVQATVLMLGYVLAREPEELKPALDQVRRWSEALRAQRARVG